MGLWVERAFCLEDVVAVRSLLALLCITLSIVITSSPRANAEKIPLYESDDYSPTYKSDHPVGFNWIFGRYDFDRIEEYVDEYYIERYKYWERYVVNKQREFAGRFGLSDIFFRPDFSRYDRTKVALTKRVWGNRLLFRYLAPVGDPKEFELFIALKPYHSVTFFVKGDTHGGGEAALVINRPLGRDKNGEHNRRRLNRLLGQMKRLAN